LIAEIAADMLGSGGGAAIGRADDFGVVRGAELAYSGRITQLCLPAGTSMVAPPRVRST
jgi:hypothetical protein